MRPTHLACAAGALAAVAATPLVAASAPTPGVGLVLQSIAGARPQIAVLGPHGGRRTLASGPAALLQPALGGGLLAFCQRMASGRARIVVRGADGRQTPLTRARALNISPAVSADGAWVAYRDATAGRVYLVSSRGGPRRAVTPPGVADAAPAFSPDGTHLALARREPGDLVAAVVLLTLTPDPAGVGPPSATPERRLAEGGGGPSFSPDGTRVVYSRRGSLRVITLAGGPIRRLTPGLPNGFSARDSHPVFSGDGAFVYFARTTPLVPGLILRVPATGGPLQRVTTAALWPAGGA